MEALSKLIVLWLVAQLNLPHTDTLPTIVELPPQDVVVTAGVPRAKAASSGIVALYKDNTIYISTAYAFDPVTYSSIIVHEMVHHLQDAGRVAYPCPAAREAVAYEAQALWLKQFGRNLLEELNIDTITLFFRTRCLD